MIFLWQIQSNNLVEILSAMKQKKTSFFSAMFFQRRINNEDEDDKVSRYLRTGAGEEHVDILDWWKLYQVQYSYLLLVLKYILSIPGSSVSVERIFNVGSDVIALRCHSLKP